MQLEQEEMWWDDSCKEHTHTHTIRHIHTNFAHYKQWQPTVGVGTSLKRTTIQQMLMQVASEDDTVLIN